MKPATKDGKKSLSYDWNKAQQQQQLYLCTADL
jgi:hypothetical protein